MIDLLSSIFSETSKVMILGFGKEGRSTYKFLRMHFPELLIGIADSNSEIKFETELLENGNLDVFIGQEYLDSLADYDIIIKSPGVNIDSLPPGISKKVTSQTNLFLQCYAKQVIGVTGTKGKSTTSSLILHILEQAGKSVVLLGNIGVPSFDMIDKINGTTIVVYELSAHQLEIIQTSPHIAVLLNIFPEHLDYFKTYNEYQQAKYNICNFQNDSDYLIVHESLISNLQDENHVNSINEGLVSDEMDSRVIVFSKEKDDPSIDKLPLLGNHNKLNIQAALSAVAEVGVDKQLAIKYLSSFKSLPHRLEYIGEFQGVKFVNDSISTIPESVIAAVEALKNVDTLILGGYDRGLDYTAMVRYLLDSNVNNFIFLGKAGKRMYNIFKLSDNKNLFITDSLQSAFSIILKVTEKGSSCLLSPAAASYDQFHNFEHRGDRFKSLAAKL